MANETARGLRKTATRQERKLWRYLRGLKQEGFHFRRQVPIDGYIVDFVCYHPKVAIEIDGGGHSYASQLRRDARRDSYLTKSGFRVLRIWNNEADSNLEGVLEFILDELAPHPARKRTYLPARGR
jgi:very-short-patch-repair endonuclease